MQQKMSNKDDDQEKKKETWLLNYEAGTKYELYRVPLKKQIFEGLKYKDVCMILY